jgi:tetratricopeptide (TPR) repeat protein
MAKKPARATTSNSLLRAARKQRAWTQQQVADLIGAPHVLNVTRWERGTTSPSAYYTQRLCQLFGQTPKELGLLAPEDDAIEEKSASPGYWNVPYRRNPFFTGRETLLLQISQTLLSAENTDLPQSYALSGLGGIGKTQLALEYAYRSRPAYQAIFWVRAANHETLIADLSAIASLLDLPQREQGDQRVVIEAVLGWFQHNQGWLLILDNADDLALIEEFVPRTGQGHLLITTRTQATGKLATSIEVEKLAVQESTLLLLHRSKLLATAATLENVPAPLLAQATALALELDGLPLALDQAAAYIEESGCSLADYCQLYERHQMDMLKRASQVFADYPSTVASTWSLSFQQVEQTNPAAADLLRMAAFLHPDAIPEAIMTQSESSSLLFNEAIWVLRRYSLLKRDAQTRLLNIHRLVQSVLKDMMDGEMRRYWAERTVHAVSAAFPKPEFEQWTVCERCLPHALLAAQLIEQYHFSFSEAWRLLEHAGCYLRERGQYSQAEALLERALALCEQVQGPGHLDTAALLSSLQWLYHLQGRYDQAEPLMRQALKIREKALGPQHPTTADAYNDLAFLLVAQGKYEQAESLYQRALLIMEQVFGPKHRETAELLNNLGELYQAQRKYEHAESLYQRAILIMEQASGPEHPNVAISLTCLAYLYMEQGKYQQAESLHQRALTIFTQTVGPNHPYIGRVLNNLGELYQAQDKHEQAESLYQQALAIYELTLGRHHPHVRQTFNKLASLYNSQGKDEQQLHAITGNLLMPYTPPAQ